MPLELSHHRHGLVAAQITTTTSTDIDDDDDDPTHTHLPDPPLFAHRIRQFEAETPTATGPPTFCPPNSVVFGPKPSLTPHACTVHAHMTRNTPCESHPNRPPTAGGLRTPSEALKLTGQAARSGPDLQAVAGGQVRFSWGPLFRGLRGEAPFKPLN